MTTFKVHLALPETLPVVSGGGGAVEALLPNDYYRLARALEIIYTSGQPRETFAVPGSTSIASTPGVLKVRRASGLQAHLWSKMSGRFMCVI